MILWVEINELCNQEFKLGSWQRWAYELEAGTLTFSNDGVPRVIATIQAVGSASNKSGTGMWGWANRSLPAKSTDQLYRVKQFGERERLSQLTEVTSLQTKGLVGSWPLLQLEFWMVKGSTAARRRTDSYSSSSWTSALSIPIKAANLGGTKHVK
jgi:uncharacterized protein DUF6882